LNSSFLRILNDPPLDGPTNMARDEALLEAVGRGAAPPTLRLYEWAAPTVSLGYFQKIDDFDALPPPAGRLYVVRRPTGGGAILHDRELTYALALPAAHPLLAGGPNALYALVHDAVIACLNACGAGAWRGCESDGSSAARGPFFCFARRHCFDVLVDRDKIAGSAQRRTRTALLQHGSIITGSRFDQQPTAVVPWNVKEITRRLRTDLVIALSDATGLDAQAGGWTVEELSRAEELLIKYAGSVWTRRT